MSLKMYASVSAYSRDMLVYTDAGFDFWVRRFNSMLQTYRYKWSWKFVHKSTMAVQATSRIKWMWNIGNVDQLLALLYLYVFLGAGITIPNAKPQYKSNTTYNRSTNRAYGHNMNVSYNNIYFHENNTTQLYPHK